MLLLPPPSPTRLYSIRPFRRFRSLPQFKKRKETLLLSSPHPPAPLKSPPIPQIDLHNPKNKRKNKILGMEQQQKQEPGGGGGGVRVVARICPCAPPPPPPDAALNFQVAALNDPALISFIPRRPTASAATAAASG